MEGEEIKEIPEEKKEPEPKGKVQKDKRGCSWWMVVIISIAVSVLSIFTYDRFFATKVVSIDIKGFLAEQRDLYVAGKIDDKQVEANLDRLEQTANNIPSNKVVIMGDAVVRNAEKINP